MPEISVIMGVYNQFNKKILLDSVQSILNQTFQDLEFIIYDDGSDPKAGQILREIKELDDRIVLIGHEQNHGLAFSLNSCIDAARGKYIARMDCDDISYPDRLEKQKRFLDENLEYAWVGCNIELFDDKGKWGRRVMPQFPAKEDYLRFSPYAHPTVMYRAAIFNEDHKYSVSRNTLRCEDYEIFMKLRSSGLKGANLQEFLFCYRENFSSYKKRTLKHRWKETKCRYRNFRTLGILFPKGWIYVLRPMAACLIPYRVIALYKHRESAIKQDRHLPVSIYSHANQ